MSDSDERIIRLQAVLERTGLSRSTLYRKIQLGTFPKQIRIPERCAGWRQSAVSEWLRDSMIYSSDDHSDHRRHHTRGRPSSGTTASRRPVSDKTPGPQPVPIRLAARGECLSVLHPGSSRLPSSLLRFDLYGKARKT
jgi:prophage regulatory protein